MEQSPAVFILQKANEKLTEENNELRKQLRLYHENCGLRAASVMSALLTWLDSDVFTSSKTGGVVRKLEDVLKGLNIENVKKIQNTTLPFPASGNARESTATNWSPAVEDLFTVTSRGKSQGSRRKKANSGHTSDAKPSDVRRISHRKQKQHKSRTLERTSTKVAQKAITASLSPDDFDTDSPGSSSTSDDEQVVPKEWSESGHVWTRGATTSTPGSSRVGAPVATSTPARGPKFQQIKVPQTVTPKRGDDSSTEKSYKHPTPWKRGSQAELEALEKFLGNARPNKRLIGEVAFQLDRQILNYVFSVDANHQKRRFYGYIVQNIPEMIKKESVDPATGQLDLKKAAKLQYRYDYVIRSLQPLGYKLDFHSAVSTDLVNRYGLLPVPSDKATAELFRLGNKSFLEDYLRHITSRHELHHVLTLFDCLCLLAQDQNQPIFVW